MVMMPVWVQLDTLMMYLIESGHANLDLAHFP